MNEKMMTQKQLHKYFLTKTQERLKDLRKLIGYAQQLVDASKKQGSVETIFDLVFLDVLLQALTTSRIHKVHLNPSILASLLKLVPKLRDSKLKKAALLVLKEEYDEAFRTSIFDKVENFGVQEGKEV